MARAGLRDVTLLYPHPLGRIFWHYWLDSHG